MEDSNFIYYIVIIALIVFIAFIYRSSLGDNDGNSKSKSVKDSCVNPNSISKDGD